MLRLAGRNFCVSYALPKPVEAAHRIGQSVMLDNGAFTFYQQGTAPAWEGYIEWCTHWLAYKTTWAIIPDVIGGTEAENDRLLAWFEGKAAHLDRYQLAPVWHIHNSVERLVRLAADWPRVCIGSSVGAYSNVGGKVWREKMDAAMNELCGDGPAPVWLHLLKGMAMRNSEYPLASVDSSSVTVGHCNPKARKDIEAMVRRVDALQCPAVWKRHYTNTDQMALDLDAAMPVEDEYETEEHRERRLLEEEAMPWGEDDAPYQPANPLSGRDQIRMG